MIASAVLISSCTSAQSKDEYVETVDRIQLKAVTAMNQTVGDTAPDAKTQTAQLEASEAVLNAAIDELESVDIPEEAQQGHDELVRGFEDLRKLFKQTAAEVKDTESTGDFFDAMSKFSTKSAVVGADLDEAITQINNDLGAE